MIQDRYIVEVSPAQALKLSAEQVELATLVDNGSTQLLIFRDRFVACKVATRSGGIFRQGRVTDSDVTGGELQGGLNVGGRTLLLEPTMLEA